MSADPEFLTYLEMNYWISEDGSYPNLEAMCLHFNKDEGTIKVKIENCLDPLKGRGLPINQLELILNPNKKAAEELVLFDLPPVKDLVAANALDPVFVNACRIICDGVDKRSTSVKLKALGISTSQWKAFLKKSQNNVYFQKMLDESFHKDTEISFKTSLTRNVEAGDLQSMKYWAEYTGKYRPDSEILLNMGVILGKIMEILSTKLSPDDFIDVAESLESLMNAETRELTQ